MIKKRNNSGEPGRNPTDNIKRVPYLRPGVNPDMYATAVKEAKNAVSVIDRKVLKTVPKGTQYDWLNNTNFNNIVYPRDKIPDRLLRLIERRNGIVGAITTLRVQQAVEYCQISHDKNVPGWEIVLKEQKKSLSKQNEKLKNYLENFILRTQIDGYKGLEPKHESFRTTITKFVRDRLVIDKVCWEIERDRKGQAIAYWVLDGATIMPVLPGGFYGSTSQVGVGLSVAYNKLSDEIRKIKLENIPPVEEIAYIQELIFGSSGGGITAAFRDTDLIYDLGNELNDIRYYKQGFSVVEKANIAIVAFINSLTFNSNGLSRGAIPKIAIAMGKESGYTQDQLEDAQDDWMANFAAMDGQWNIPLLNGDAKVLNLLPNNRDMEYQKYMEFVAALTCSIMGVDSAELGLRLNQAQSVLSENADAKQLFSKNRGVREMLFSFKFMVDRLLELSGIPGVEDFEFSFNGINTEDKGFEVDLRKKYAESYMTVDEVRALDDLEPLPDDEGKIILNSVFIQNRSQTAMQNQGGDMGGMGGDMEGGDEGGEEGDELSQDVVDDTVDEIAGNMEKAVRLI